MMDHGRNLGEGEGYIGGLGRRGTPGTLRGALASNLRPRSDYRT